MPIIEINADEFELQNLKHFNNGKVVILYKADWCHYCQQFMPIYASLSEYTNIPFLMVDVDKNKTFIQKNNQFANTYKVSSYPTIVFYKNGKFVKKYTGNRDPVDLITKITNY